MLFDFGSQIHVHAMGQKHRRMGSAKALLIGAGGNMQNIHIGLQQLGNLNAFF